MMQLDDRKNLLKLLIACPILSKEQGRAAAMVNAGLDDLIPQLDLSQPPAVSMPLVVNFLENYGRVSFEHHALGRFLNAVRDYVGQEGQVFLGEMISKYGLMVPAAKAAEEPLWENPVSSQDYLEKIIGENTLRPIAFLQMALNASRPVAYIEVHHRMKSWSGTGFMVSPTLLLTNHHVIKDAAVIPGCVFRFNYQEDAAHNPEICKDFCALPGGVFYTNPALDYSLVELAGSPGDEWNYLKVTTQLPEINQRVSIIQHPHGLPKQISMQNNFVKYAGPKKLQYLTSTQPGSSGSPVFNDHWQVVGLHHAGGNLPEGDSGPVYFRNEGIAIGAILKDLPVELANQFTVVAG